MANKTKKGSQVKIRLKQVAQNISNQIEFINKRIFTKSLKLKKFKKA